MADDALVRRLFDGPIDVVGDVHGEVEALEALLRRLGYAPGGGHPEGRRLVFVGDLGDRGPDSPAVVRRVRRLVEEGRAQCVLGNHELNALIGRKRPETCWIHPDAPPLLDHGRLVPQEPAGAARAEVLAFFASLPLALARDDVRVVHACWDGPAADALRKRAGVVAVFQEFQERIRKDSAREGLGAVDAKLAEQNRNPVKLLTSGPEERAPAPWVLHGEERCERRVRWWEGHAGEALCVFGHYWRRTLPGDEGEEHLFAGAARNAPVGPGPAVCVDFSAGRRYRERLRPGFDGTFHTHLAALRLPERVLVYDNEDKEEPLI